jgi:NAD-dependent SIR2 family protein deacetylase
LNSSERYLYYPSQRDVLFVFGAGASSADGVPLQRELLPMILSGGIDEIDNSEIGKLFKEFISENFKYNAETNTYPALEAVFGFLDYFILHNESLNSKYPLHTLSFIKESLITLIHYVVNVQTEKSSKYYHLFWESIFEHNNNISIISLNYDDLLEQAFKFLFKTHGYIDYCIPLMNYEKYDHLKDFNFWINPRQPINVREGEDPTPFKIIKLHGSLNWKYCNCCNQLLLTPWDRKIDLNKGKLLGYTYPDNTEYEFHCPIDGTEFKTLILPPSHLKSLHHPIVSQLTSEASREILAAKKIVFIGYSMSSSDIHIKALFKKIVKEGQKLIVINPKQRETLELNYKSISENIEFIFKSFDELVSDKKLMQKLLTS